MNPIPRAPGIDSTLAFLKEGYRFIGNRCEQLQSDVFETRLMLRPVFCASGEEASAMFYHPGRFTRRHALPPTALLLLQDLGSVQVLDGEAHHHRKQLFMTTMTRENIRRLVSLFDSHWRARVRSWRGTGQIVLQTEAEAVLCAAVCEWIGVPLTEAAVRQRAEEFAAMINGAGAVGPRNWRGLRLRSRTEDWVRSIVDGIRRGQLSISRDSIAHAFAMHRDHEGELLDTRVAAVELINLLRPTVAVARFITFGALALHAHPGTRDKLRDSGDGYATWMSQEVRRYYPFFPAVGGRALAPFAWRGRQFEEGDWVLLDLYGTNHDRRIWKDPENFRPERFRDWNGSPFSFIPQGGGEFDAGHRCAGEWLTIELVKCALRLLSAMRYTVPPQDLHIDLSILPALPASGFILRDASLPAQDEPAASHELARET